MNNKPSPVQIIDKTENSDADNIKSVNCDGEKHVMSLGSHLEELRVRLIICVVVTGIIFIGCMVFYKQIWDIAMMPRQAAADLLDKPVDKLFPLQLLRPMEGFTCAFGLAFKAAIALALPVILYQAWMFVIPGLHKKEKKALWLIASAGTVLFFGGVLLAFFVASPIGLAFFANFDTSLEGTISHWRADEYLSFVAMACIGFGLSFETPLVMMALAWTGLITPEGIIKYWRHAILAMAVAGAVFTPPDPYTMIFLGTCLGVLYFSGYLLARLVSPKGDYIDNDIGED